MKRRMIAQWTALAVLVSALTASCGGQTQKPAGDTGNTTQNAAASSNYATGDNGTVYEFKLGHTGAPNHHYQEVLVQFAEDVKTKTDGHVLITVFPSDQLGNPSESTEGVMLGTHDMVLTSDMVLSNWVPEMGILNLPFLFRDNDHLKAVLKSDVTQKLSDRVEPSGAHLLAFWDNGFRHITNSKRPIETPQDLAGLKIRVPEGKVYLDTFNALGALPTVISFGELYSALQLNTVEGQENPVAHIITQKFYEVQKYVSKTYHIHSCSPLLINRAKFDQLPSEYQTILTESAVSFGLKHIDRVAELEAGQWQECAEKGMTISEPELKPFEEQVQSVYDQAREQFGNEIIDEILALK